MVTRSPSCEMMCGNAKMVGDEFVKMVAPFVKLAPQIPNRTICRYIVGKYVHGLSPVLTNATILIVHSEL